MGEAEQLKGLSSWGRGSGSVKVPGAIKVPGASSSRTFMGTEGNFVPGLASCTGVGRCRR